MTFKVHIITPERSLPEMSADHVTIIAVDGQVGIRTDHAPLVALLAEAGYAVIKTFGQETFRAFAVRGGVAQMLHNDLRIFTPSAVDVHELDVPALTKRADSTADAQEKSWLEHQVTVARQLPAPAGRV